MTERPQGHDASRGAVVVIGNSMYPTLKHFDRVYVTPCDGRKVRVGDVIVHLPPCKCDNVVHRVIFTGADGVRTRGDGMLVQDPWVTEYDNVVGRVDFAQRGNRKRRVRGGKAGQLVGHAGHAYAWLRECVKRPIWLVYRFAYGTGVFRALLPRSMKPRILAFSKPGGEELQLIMGKWTVGTRPPGRKRWKIKPPFRLFIDEATLGTPGEEQREAGACSIDAGR